MKVKLTAGAELDLLSANELREELTRAGAWRAEIARGVRFRKFSGTTTVASGAWSIGGGANPNNQKDPLGPDPGFVWAVTRLAVSGPGFLLGTDTFSAYVDDASPTRLIQEDIPGYQEWDKGVLVLNGGEQLVLSGTGSSSAAATGEPSSVLVTQPAAGADWSQTIPAGQTWTLQGWRGLLTTDANVANRTVNFLIERPGAQDLAIYTAGGSQPASNVIVYQGTQGVAELTSARNGGLPMPFPNAIQLEEGAIIRTITGSIQAGDQWSAIQLSIVRNTDAAAASNGDAVYVSGQAIELPAQLAWQLL